MIDEFQRAPELLLAIKRAVDTKPVPGKFLLTGSANILATAMGADALTGRAELMTLWPLSQDEIKGSRGDFVDRLFAGDMSQIGEGDGSGRLALLEPMLAGGFPEAVGRRDWQRRSDWFNSYVDTVVTRDARDLAKVYDVEKLLLLLTLAARRVSGLVNYAELSRGVGLAQNSVKRYFGLLERIFLVLRIKPWHATSALA